jgi:hypothetical protein
MCALGEKPNDIFSFTGKISDSTIFELGQTRRMFFQDLIFFKYSSRNGLCFFGCSPLFIKNEIIQPEKI